MTLILQFILAHLAVMVAWGALIAMLTGIGCWFRRLFGRSPLADSDPFFLMWTGYACTLLVLQAWHFIRPIDGWIFAVLVVAGAGGLVSERAELRNWLARSLPTRPSASLVVTAALLAWMANLALGPVANFDDGAYHIATIEWSNAYRIVPGLGHLHGRLAFNSSSLLFGALLDIGPFDGRAYHLVGGILIVPLLLHSLGAIRRLATPRPAHLIGDAYAASLVIVALFTIIAHEPSSLDTDLPVALIFLACGERMIRCLAGEAIDDASTRWHFATLVLLTAAAPVLKLSAAVLAMAILLIAFWQFRDVIARSARTLWLSLAVPALLVSSWLARGVILSGHPLYPSGLFALPVSWALPADQTASEAAWVTFSARVLNQHDIPLDGSWIGAWFKGLGASPQDAAMLALPVALLLLAAWLVVRTPATAGAPRFPAGWWLLLVAPVSGLAFWFAVAPHPRFAQGSLWIAVCTCFGLTFAARHREDLARAAWVSRLSRRFTVTFTTVLLTQAIFSPVGMRERVGWIGRSTALGGLAIRPGPDRGLHPTGQSRLLPYRTNSGLQLYVPVSNNLCWRTTLLCTPHPSPYVRLRTEGRPQDGFVADSGRWAPVRWPDPLTPFLPYWRCQERTPGGGVARDRACAMEAANARTDTLKAVVLTQGGDTAGFMRPPRTGAAGRR